MTRQAFTRTRFAPAPTGQLHIGHVVNAIHVWGLGHTRGAEVLLRIEDHDRQRCRREYERALLDDLDWLGFVPDDCPTDVYRAGACEGRQSDRHARYAAVADALAESGRLYACRCSRQDWARAGRRSHPPGWCPRGCRADGLTRQGDVLWKALMPPGTVAFEDLLVGPRTEPIGGDVVVRDRLGNWTYQFAVTVDDRDQGIDLVIRGRDLLLSTARQIQLAAEIGRPAPATFAHHGLVMKSPTRKLSKADHDTGIGTLRAAGWSREQIVGSAAALAGLAPAGTRLGPAEVQGLF